MIQQLIALIEKTTGLDRALQMKIFTSAAIMVCLSLIRSLIVHSLLRRITDIKTRYLYRKTSVYVAVTLGLVLVGRVWFSGIQSLLTYFGLLSAGLAIALKDPLTNFAGWLFILWRRPFRVGDRIQIGDLKGDVIDTRISYFLLMEIGNWVQAEQSTGRVVFVPNSRIFTESLCNYNEGFNFIWNEIPVVVTFESDWKKARQILERIADTYGTDAMAQAEKQIHASASRYMIFYANLKPRVYTSVVDIGVMLTIRYLCVIRDRRESEEKIWEDILNEFAAAPDIDFAYPTRRMFNNTLEGKAGAGGPPRTEAKS